MRAAEWLSTVPIAHRGLHDEASPENTLEAFGRAADAGFGIELDVRCTVDDQLAVFHDSDTLRLTGASHAIARTTAQDLAGLTVLGTPCRIPMLPEVLALVDGRVPLLVEVKPGPRPSRVGPMVAAVLGNYPGPFAVQSFDPRIVRWFTRHEPDVLRGQLVMRFGGLPQRLVLGSMPANVVTRPDFIACRVDDLDSPAVTMWRRVLDVPLIVWTVDTAEQVVVARQQGANVIFEGAAALQAVSGT